MTRLRSRAFPLTLLLALVAFGTGSDLFPPAQASPATCTFADKGYSTGARVCFCPQIIKQVGAFKVIQERWVCGEKSQWQKAKDLCAAFSTSDMRKALRFLNAIERGSC